MKTALEQNRSIQQNLTDAEFVKRLQEHPAVQRKVKQTKKNLDLLIADKKLPPSK
ncbi:hypothetical protein [Spirosoma areae]